MASQSLPSRATSSPRPVMRRPSRPALQRQPPLHSRPPKRDIKIQVWVRPEERIAWQQEAWRRGISLSDWLRGLANGDIYLRRTAADNENGTAAHASNEEGGA